MPGKQVTLRVSPALLKKYESIWGNVVTTDDIATTIHQPQPSSSASNSSLISPSSKPSVKKIVIKKSVGSPSLPNTRTDTPLTSTGTPQPNGIGPNKGGRVAMAASANGGLLELDKTGAPCKRWSKQPRKFKSFTGYETQVMMFKETPV